MYRGTIIILIIFLAFSYANANGVNPTFTVAMNSDFTQTVGIGGWEWQPGSTVTVEIDYEADGTFDYSDSTTADSDGTVSFLSGSQFPVQEGSFVRMSDAVNTKEHYVDFMTLSEINLISDTLMGTAREDTILYVYVLDMSSWVYVGQDQADSDENWVVDLSEIFDILPGSQGYVQTADDDGDHTQIDWIVPSTNIVAIDIKPGSDPNCFNINGHGVIPVAILGSEGFDISQIDKSTLLFSGLEVRVRGNKGPLCSIEYSNEDTYQDLVCHFEDDSSAWSAGDSEATLTGKLIDGTPFEGTDSICVVP
jgi:hypothetical protein